jgi:hypothetical protein
MEDTREIRGVKVRKVGTTELKDESTQAPRAKTPALRKLLELSKDEFCKVNWYYPGGREAFPLNQRLWTVDRYYPYAKDGGLLCDLVMLNHKLDEAKMKARHFKNTGFKYVAVNYSGRILDLENETYMTMVD